MGGAKLSILKQMGEWSEQASCKSEPINTNNRNSYSNERFFRLVVIERKGLQY